MKRFLSELLTQKMSRDLILIHTGGLDPPKPVSSHRVLHPLLGTKALGALLISEQ